MTQSLQAWNQIQVDVANPTLRTENLADAVFQLTATHAVLPVNVGQVWEAAVHHNAATGDVAIRISGSLRTGAVPDPDDYPSLAVPHHSLDPSSPLLSPLSCGMPNAAQEVANVVGGAFRSPAPPGITYVTEGGIRLTNQGALQYIPPCYNCGGDGYTPGTFELNKHLQPLPPPDTVLPGLRPFDRVVFTPPLHWGWQA